MWIELILQKVKSYTENIFFMFFAFNAVENQKKFLFKK